MVMHGAKRKQSAQWNTIRTSSPVGENEKMAVFVGDCLRSLAADAIQFFDVVEWLVGIARYVDHPRLEWFI